MAVSREGRKKEERDRFRERKGIIKKGREGGGRVFGGGREEGE